MDGDAQRSGDRGPVPEEASSGVHDPGLTGLEFLWEPSPPWIYVGYGEPARHERAAPFFYARDGVDACVRVLRGWKMHTVAELMTEAGAALQFFAGFGENWHALEELLCYLDEWLPADAYVIVIERAEEALSGDEEQVRALLGTFHRAGEFWSTPIVDGPEQFRRGRAPFHLLLNISAEHPAAVRKIVEVAARAGVPVRTDSTGT